MRKFVILLFIIVYCFIIVIFKISSTMRNASLFRFQATVKNICRQVLLVSDVANIAASYLYLPIADAYVVTYGIQYLDDQIMFLCKSKQELVDHFQYQDLNLDKHNFNLNYFHPNNDDAWVTVRAIKNNRFIPIINRSLEWIDFQDCGTCVHSVRKRCKCRLVEEPCNRCRTETKRDWMHNLRIAMLLLPKISGNLSQRDGDIFIVHDTQGNNLLFANCFVFSDGICLCNPN